MTQDDMKKHWAEKISKHFVGKKIVNVRYLTDDETQELDWYGSSLVIFLEDGTHFYASRDDEGNGPGALFTNVKEISTIGVV